MSRCIAGPSKSIACGVGDDLCWPLYAQGPMRGSLLTSGLELVGWWAMFLPWHAHGALTGVGLCRAQTRVCIAHDTTGKWEDSIFVYV